MIQWPTTHDNDSMQAYTRTGLQTEDREKFASSSSHTHWVSQGFTKIVNDPGLVKIICWIFILKPWLRPVLSCIFCLVCPAPLLHLTIALCYTLLWLLHTLLPRLRTLLTIASIAHSSAYCTLFWLLRTLPLLKASLPQCQRSELCMRSRHSFFAV